MCDNDIQKLGNFPNLVKCRQLYICNNRVSYIASDLHSKLPNLEEICLSNNDVRSLSNIKRLEKCTCLKYLSLLRNPVVLEKHYRRFVIFTLPQVKFLDFNRIKDAERQDAKNFFTKTSEGKLLIAQISAKAKQESEEFTLSDDDMELKSTIEPIAMDAGLTNLTESKEDKKLREISQAQRIKIKNAILKATSIEEVERLNRMLQAGYIPSDEFQ